MRATHNTDWPNGTRTTRSNAFVTGTTHRSKTATILGLGELTPLLRTVNHQAMPPSRFTGLTSSTSEPRPPDDFGERARRIAADVADSAVELAVKLLVAGDPEDEAAADLDGRGQRPQRTDVVVDVLEHVDRDHRGDGLLEIRPLPQLELPDLHLGTRGEPVRHDRDGGRVNVGQNKSIQIVELLRELAEPGTDLEDRSTAVRRDQLVLVAAISGFIAACDLQLTAGGRGERTAVIVHVLLLGCESPRRNYALSLLARLTLVAIITLG